MKDLCKGLLLVAALATGVLVYEAPVPASPADGGRLMGERDKGKEDQVSKLFETVRADAKISQLTRIRNRDSLEQSVCTIALTGTLRKLTTTDTSTVYKTLQPESIFTELKQLASSDDLHPKNNPSYTRYSVAVWRLRDSLSGEVAYWVGVQLFWSAAMEFFDYHFTDDIYYHNDWKKYVAPECRGK
jgi:hypothetical protein